MNRSQQPRSAVSRPKRACKTPSPLKEEPWVEPEAPVSKKRKAKLTSKSAAASSKGQGARKKAKTKKAQAKTKAIAKAHAGNAVV